MRPNSNCVASSTVATLSTVLRVRRNYCSDAFLIRGIMNCATRRCRTSCAVGATCNPNSAKAPTTCQNSAWCCGRSPTIRASRHCHSCCRRKLSIASSAAWRIARSGNSVRTITRWRATSPVSVVCCASRLNGVNSVKRHPPTPWRGLRRQSRRFCTARCMKRRKPPTWPGERCRISGAHRSNTTACITAIPLLAEFILGLQKI